MATAYLLVGLPGSGKTTRAVQLAAEHHALRLTPDEWMIPLFGEPEAGGRRDILEGRLLWLAGTALRLGTDVVLDFGFWSRNERAAVCRLAAQAGAAHRIVYLPVDRASQLARVAHRWAHAPGHTFAMTTAELDRWRDMFEEPDGAELSGTVPTSPPAGWPDWNSWAADRWPSIMDRPDGGMPPGTNPVDAGPGGLI